jgi:hypothetical protein
VEKMDLNKAGMELKIKVGDTKNDISPAFFGWFSPEKERIKF